MPQLRPLLRAASLAVAATVLVPGTAFAGQPRPEPQQSVTVMLSSPDRGALDALAAHRRAATPQRLAALRPDAVRRRHVAETLSSLGLRVTGVGTWSVTAVGRASRVRAVFGSARAVHPHAWRAQALPRVPAALRAYATGVFGGDETRPAARPLTTPSFTYQTAGLHGDAIRAAYGAPLGTVPAGGAAATIATVQLSGWDDSDLTTYAQAAGLPDPVASGQYTAVPVDNADPTQPDGSGGEGEVGLDQEAILAAAPYARQRAYFAPENTPAGFADSIYAVGDDATDPATDGYHLTALSISWGGCESPGDSPNDPYYQTMEQALAYTVLAGVTVFAASGDAGAYDCWTKPGDPVTVAVDYPASSPFVVAVGGTTLDTASNTETAWAGSGGGESALFGRPSWQPGGPSTSLGREVPDISVVGDPHTGFAAYTSTQGGWWPTGGTSLASPLAAAMLTSTLVDGGYSHGVGDIHPALYAAPATAFRDVTSGTNGGDDGTPQHGTIGPGLSAGPGYDQVTGLGSPLWTSLRPFLVGDPHVAFPAEFTTSTAPLPLSVAFPSWASYTGWSSVMNPADDPGCTSATSPAPPAAAAPTADGYNVLLVAAVDAAGGCHEAIGVVFLDQQAPTVGVSAQLSPPTTPQVLLRWSGDDPEPAGSTDVTQSGVRDYVYSVTRDGVPVVSRLATTATSRVLTGNPGSTYVVTVQSRDEAGNLSAARSATVAVPIDDTHFRYSAGWARASSGQDFGGSVGYSSLVGATVTRVAVGRTFTVLMRTGPSYGNALVSVDGTPALTVSLTASSVHYRVPFVVRTSALRSHTVTVTVRRPTGAGTKVVVDALVPNR